MHQVEMISLNDLVPADHQYRHFKAIWQFKFVNKKLKKLEKDNPYKGYGLDRLFKCLLLQFMENLSDRQLARFMQENTAAKWFCEFSLSETTPDHTVYCRFRKRLGATFLSTIFANLRDQLKAAGLMSEVFTFVDASHLISKASLWEEHDKRQAAGYEKLNNEVLPKVAHDKEARLGCKGKNKYWYGYKRHRSCDMQSGLINKVAITPANVIDSKGLKHVCPDGGGIYADKGYCDRHAKAAANQRGCALRAIKKNNMKDKNHDQDRWLSYLRFPYERIFSQAPKRVRYVGVAKNQLAEYFQAICFNLKRLQVLSPPNLVLT